MNYRMDTLIELLNKVRLIKREYITKQEERASRGENFNIFSVLKIQRDEEKLHSAFIAELLNPYGSHGLKDTFLNLFLQQIGLADFDFDTKEVKVDTEYFIGYKNRDNTEGGKIDILLTNDNKKAIIIENKIDARDQEMQLVRYNNYGRDTFGKGNYRLVYLTKNGDDASEKSIGHERISYKRISYREDVLKWLTACLEKSASRPLIRETLQQYIMNLKDILNMMNDEISIDKLMEVVISPNYLSATLDILKHEKEIAKYIRTKFISQLEEIAERKGFELGYNERIVDLDDNTWIWLHNSKISENWAIWIGADKHNKGNGVYFGICPYESGKPVEEHLLPKIDPIWDKKTPNFPFGHDYLRGEKGVWWDWSNYTTLEDMANGNLAKYIEEKIIDIVLGEKLLQKIEELTTPQK